MYGDSGLREGAYSRRRAVSMGKEISRGAEELSLCPSVTEPTCLSFVVLATAQRQKDKAALNVALLQLIQTWNGKKSICNLCMYTNKAGCQESRFTSQKAFCRTPTKKWQKKSFFSFYRQQNTTHKVTDFLRVPRAGHKQHPFASDLAVPGYLPDVHISM